MAEQKIAELGTTHDLSGVVVPLLKGVVYQENDPAIWIALQTLRARIRDYVAVMGLELVLDESEGYAFLRSRQTPADGPDDDTAPTAPRLIARRPLSFPVSLLLALLRKKLAEFDAGGGDTRLVLTRDEIVDLLRVFLPENSNDVRMIDQIETYLNRIAELGFLRRLKSGDLSRSSQPATFEVRRILKAFIDAQWLADFDTRLAAYQGQFNAASEGDG